MYKTFLTNAWDFGLATAEIVKISSRGLFGEDAKLLVKRASEEFVHQARKVAMHPDELPVHIIAMGATEGYGPNRNGDGFKAAALRAYHKTFEKYAKYYRHHQNRDPSKSYGVIKLAYWNEPMKRVELLLGLNKTAEAAKRNGGLIADKEMERLGNKQDFAGSMACKVAYDVCSVCDNRAPSRREYCLSIKEGGMCPGFGCRNGLTRVMDNGHIQHVDNPHPSFFDYSGVFKPADRIAYGGVADYLSKAAAAGQLPSGAELAELIGITAPLNLLLAEAEPYAAKQIKLAYELADIEKQVENTISTHREKQAASAFALPVTPFDFSELGQPGSEKSAYGLGALASQKVAMPVREFLRWLSGGDSDKVASVAEAVSGLLPGIYNRMIASGNLEADISNNPFRPSEKLAPLAQRKWASKCAADYSLSVNAVFERASLSAIRQIPATVVRTKSELGEKWASVSGQAETLARHYAMYKLAFLAEQSTEMPLTAHFAIRQNYVC